MEIGIRAIAHVLPKDRLTNAELIRRHGFDGEFLAQKLGIEARCRAAETETVSDLAVAAGGALFKRGLTRPQDVGLLILVTQTPEPLIPHSSAIVQARLGLGKGTPAFDVGLGCSGFVYGLSIAVSFMRVQGITTGLLVSAETYSKILDPADRNTAPLFGDAACATLLTAEPRYVPGRFVFGTDGSQHDALTAPRAKGASGGDPYLRMNGRVIFNFMMTEIPANIESCLSGNGVAKEEVDLWVFHQASRYLVETLAARMGIPLDKVILDLSDVGNTVSSTIPITLERQVLNRTPLPRFVCICGFGTGLSWASTILFLRESGG